jgi:hypothetical protein
LTAGYWEASVAGLTRPLADPRRALGHLLGNGVRFPAFPSTAITDVLLAGEGIETVLSLKCALPSLPMIAALSANHLAALEFAPMLARLYVARDRVGRGVTVATDYDHAGLAEPLLGPNDVHN